MKQDLIICLLSSALYTYRDPSTNQLLFMQNKPNVKDAQINVSSYMKSKYEKLDTWLSGKNKPNLVRPALFAKESVDAAPDDALPDWSNPIRQACVVCEGVAGLIKACPERIYTELRRSSRMGQFPKD